MAHENGADQDWVSEFKRFNQAASLSPSSPPASRRGQRRKHDRFSLDQARVQLFQDGLLATIGIGRENLARSPIDLSEGGIRVLLHKRLKPDTKVRVRLEIEKFGDAIEASGLVRWCFESGTCRGEYHAGIMFTDLGGSQKKKIAVMRDWFTSSKCIILRAAREHDPAGLLRTPSPSKGVEAFEDGRGDGRNRGRPRGT